MPHFALAGHVFVCLQGEHVVFLDVRKDRYFALEADKTASLGALVAGWPVKSVSDAALCHADVVHSSVIALLLERGLLSADAQAGKNAAPVVVERITGELSADAYERAVPLGAATIIRFITCALGASFRLKFLGFERVVQRVSRRNLDNADASFDVAEAHRVVTAFASLRPFFFTAKDMCLFEAFALSEFLARHGLYPQWVFGVQARPFAAHCWLQHGGIVLNDTADHVGRYVPIMVV